MTMPVVTRQASAIQTTNTRYQSVTMKAGISMKQRRAIRSMRLLILLLFALLSPAFAQAQGTLTPTPQITFLDASGNPISNGKICTYAAGTTNPQATYFNPDLDISHVNANPIRTDSAGRPTTGGIYLIASSYKFLVLTAGTDGTCATGTTVYSQDNVAAVPATAVALDVTGTAGTTIAAGNVVYLANGSGGTTLGRWYLADADNTYSSITASLVGIATTAIATGSTGTIRIAGRMTGLSALTAGSDYYASATDGALTATPPANARFVGRADTTTTLVLAAGEGALRTPDSDGTNSLVIKTTSNLTADRLLTIVPGDAARTLTLTGNATLNQDVSSTGTPTFGATTFNGNVIAGTDNTFDWGASGATRFRDLFLARNALIGGTLGVTGHVTLEAVTSTGATGTGKLVFDAAATHTGTFNITQATGSFAMAATDGSAAFTSGISGNALTVKNSHATNPSGIIINYTATDPNGTGNEFLIGYGNNGGNLRFSMRSNGGLANFSANNVNLSDARTKDIFGPATSQRALFRKLKFVQARYKDAPESPIDVMVTAQQVQTVYPDLVTWFDADKGLLGVRDDALMLRAMKVIQEQDAAITALERRVKALEAKPH